MGPVSQDPSVCKGSADLIRGGGLPQADPASQIHSVGAHPVAVKAKQPFAGAFVGTSAQGAVRVHVPCPDNGDIQDQGQVLVGGVQLDGNRAGLDAHHAADVPQAIGIVAVPPGCLQRGDHVLGGEGRAIVKLHAGPEIQGVGPQIRADLKALTEPGLGCSIRADSKEPLVEKAKQLPIDAGFGPIGVEAVTLRIGKGQILRRGLLRVL